jgi:agmatine deiminase
LGVLFRLGMSAQSGSSLPRVFQPAEWAPHDSCWLAWPWDASLWEDNLLPAQKEFVALCGAIQAGGGERLEVLVPDEHHHQVAAKALAGLEVKFHHIPVGDIWLRDTAPIFVQDREHGTVHAHVFAFNGWGAKYFLKHDDHVAGRVAEASALQLSRFPLVLEGGSVEVDGEGTCLTTKQCLLNRNRNPNLSKQEIEAALGPALGVEKILWLGDGLINDHTDGHIDTIARFVGPAAVVCMHASGSDDPNAEILARIETDLRSFTDARGRKLRVTTIPSPGRIVNDDDEVVPASYVNFYIGNKSVVVPTYGVVHDAAAVAAIAKLFPNHRTVGLSARSILSGGGAFHCITQQQPRRPE